MTAAETGAARADALDAYLAQREADGYRIETRTDLQAVICRRHRLYFLLRWIARASAQQRLVVSVDQDGEVTSVEAEPVRW
ncbi:MAG TPA: hypothetical protein VGF23_24170 [Gaiellaceae bacterium]|jgi:type II secretory pathway component PulM